MAYSTSSPPSILSLGGLTNSSIRVWGYVSTHTSTSISAVANFFSNGYKLGMRPGDVVHCVKNSTASVAYEHTVGRVTAASSTGGGATVTATKVSTA